MSIAKVMGLLGLTIMMLSCGKEQVDKKPRITFESIDYRNTKKDTIDVKFKFTDGDADIGSDMEPTIYFKVVESDTLIIYEEYMLPIAGAAVDAKKGVTGESKLSILNVFSVGDTFSLEIWLKDRARNESNHITTSKFAVY